MSSNAGSKGFTLIEVMLAVSILALGTLIVQEGFVRSATFFGRYANTLKAEAWMEQKIWEVKEGLVYSQSPNLGRQEGSFQGSNKTFAWSLETGYARQGRDIYTLDLTVTWNEGNRPVSAIRSMVLAKCNFLV